MSSSIAYYIQGLMMQRKGPVFVTAFNPLVVVIVSIMSFFVLGQGTYLGGYVNNNLFITWFSFGNLVLINLNGNLYFRGIGVVVLTVGVYTVLWAKHLDDDGEAICREDNPTLEAVKCCSGNNGLSIMPKIDEAHEDVETGKIKSEEKESSAVVVGFGCGFWF